MRTLNLYARYRAEDPPDRAEYIFRPTRATLTCVSQTFLTQGEQPAAATRVYIMAIPETLIIQISQASQDLQPVTVQVPGTSRQLHGQCHKDFKPIIFFNMFIGYIYHITIQQVRLQDIIHYLKCQDKNTQTDSYKN